jgi:hypothetical protein
MRHVLVLNGEDLDDKGVVKGDRVAMVAGTVIDPVFPRPINRIAEKRLKW